ncbi:MAG: hypothetical protein M3444_22005, partial [Acidobacteriota bacterium]|nr:hypothetical protein [Acidobacteriota bacterium]
MKKLPSLVAALLASSLALSSASLTHTRAQTQPAGQPTNTPTPAPAEEDVVRVDANLVQLDAVVTDDAGRQVTDLRAEEFEILEDGRPQQITNFSYVSNAGGPLASGGGAGPTTRE